MKKIAGVIILYYPDQTLVSNIASYLDYLDILYIVDNSEIPNELAVAALLEDKKVKYFCNQENKGIAYALNQGAKQAIKDGYDYLLTMDQDSKAQSSMMQELLGFLHENDCSTIGIITPVHKLSNFNAQAIEMYSQVVLTTMTSGNLLNLAIYQQIGGFDEKLFIDYVDHEYCLRLYRYGFTVVQVNTAFLEHKLGKYKILHIGNLFKFSYTNHSALRRYYITRNRFYVAELYHTTSPEFVKLDKKAFWRELGKIILFEGDKINKLRYIISGIYQYKKRIFGVYQ